MVDLLCNTGGKSIKTKLLTMKKLQAVSFALALCAMGATVAKADQDIITKTFPITAGGKLTLNVDRG